MRRDGEKEGEREVWGRGWDGEVGGGEGEKKLNQTERTECACA